MSENSFMPNPQLYNEKAKKTAGTRLTQRQYDALRAYCREHKVRSSRLIRELLFEKIGYEEPKKDT